MTSLKTLNEDKKSFLISLLYLRAEARRMGSIKTEEAIQESLHTAMHDISQDSNSRNEIETIALFIDEVLALGEKDLKNLLVMINWFEQGKAPPHDTVQ